MNGNLCHLASESKFGYDSEMEILNYSKNASRQVKYEEIIPQLDSLLEHETDFVANQANVVAMLKEVFDFFWVGFYWAREKELVLGAFQGPIACTRIAFHRGVCGAAYTQQKSLLVPNVAEFPGHIACNSKSKSEVVVPIRDLNSGKIRGVLDIDSDLLNDFSEVDVTYLEKICERLAQKLFV